jgi:hypothetical protein
VVTVAQTQSRRQGTLSDLTEDEVMARVFVMHMGARTGPFKLTALSLCPAISDRCLTVCKKKKTGRRLCPSRKRLPKDFQRGFDTLVLLVS